MRNPYMKFQNPSFKFFFERTDKRTNGQTDGLTDGQTSRKQYAPHFFKVGGIMSLVMRKPTSCICENKGADREADQRLCFRYIHSTIPPFSKSEISSL